MIRFEEISFADAFPEYREYAAGLRLVDTFWENQIVLGRSHRIWCGEEPAGCLSLRREAPDGADMLTAFYLRSPHRARAGEIFAAVLREFPVRGAYVVSSDELFLALCADVQKQLELQAFFFDHGETPAAPPACPAQWLRPATEADRAELEQTSFYYRVAVGDPEDQQFVLRNGSGAFLGTGHIARMRLARQWGCVGMYTAPEARQHGVGRSIILLLTEIAVRQGLVPIAGCWCKNAASRATLESCGFYTQTRYLKFIF